MRNPTPVTPNYLKPLDAATYLGLSESSIEQLIERGAIAIFRPVITGKYSRKILLARQDLDAWMRKFRTPAKGEEAPPPLAHGA